MSVYVNPSAAGTASSPVILYQDNSLSTLTGTTDESLLKAWTLPGGTMGPNSILRIMVFAYDSDFTLAANADWRIRLGGTESDVTGTQLNYIQQTTALDNVWFWVPYWNLNSTAANHCLGNAYQVNSAEGANSVASTTDTSADLVFKVTCALGNAADNVTCNMFSFELLP